jgi:ABC-type sugar transport system ATPase subunit
MAVFMEGRIVQVGTPKDIFLAPATATVAAFIGTPAMNLLALEDAGSGARIKGSASVLNVGRPGAGLILGVRPEHIRLETDATGVAASVASAEYHGADTIVTARVGGETLLVRAPGQLAFAAGAPVRLAWASQDMHLFDATSGLRSNI